MRPQETRSAAWGAWQTRTWGPALQARGRLPFGQASGALILASGSTQAHCHRSRSTYGKHSSTSSQDCVLQSLTVLLSSKGCVLQLRLTMTHSVSCALRGRRLIFLCHVAIKLCVKDVQQIAQGNLA